MRKKGVNLDSLSSFLKSTNTRCQCGPTMDHSQPITMIRARNLLETVPVGEQSSRDMECGTPLIDGSELILVSTAAVRCPEVPECQIFLRSTTGGFRRMKLSG